MPALEATEATVEGERIIRALWAEADTTPCEEDAKVVRDCAWLIRCDFNYEAVETLQDQQETPLS